MTAPTAGQRRMEARQKARLAILALYDDYRREMNARRAAASIVADYNDKRVLTSPAQRTGVKRLSQSTLFSWLKQVREGGENALIDRRWNHRRTIWEMYPGLSDAIIEQVTTDPFAPCEQIIDRIGPLCELNNWRVPSQSSVLRLLKKIGLNARSKRNPRTTRRYRARQMAFDHHPELLRMVITSNTLQEAARRVILMAVSNSWPVPTKNAIEAEWLARHP